MKNKKIFIENPIVVSLILNLSVLLLSLIAYKPFFEEIDEALFAMFAEGAYGTRETHLIYPNIILGYIYKGLYSLCPSIRWHSVLQYAFLFIALTMLTYIILRCCRGCAGRSWLAIIFLLAVSYEVYVSLQYSKTAALVSVTGYICLLYTFALHDPDTANEMPVNTDGNRSRELLMLKIIAYVLIIYGILLRDDSFLLATLIMLPAGIYEFVKVILDKQKTKRRTFAFIGLFAATGCLFLLFAGINKVAYDRDPGWKSFMEYNEARTKVTDYRYDLLDYNRYGDRLKNMGISENDTLLYLTWQLGDDKVLSLDVLRSIVDGMPERKLDMECFKALAEHIYADVFVMNPLVIGTIILVMIVLAVVIRKKDKKIMVTVVTQLIIFAGILIYFEYCRRWSHRIVFAAMLVVAASFSYFAALMHASLKKEDYSAPGERSPYEGMAAGSLILLIIACITMFLGNRFEYNDYMRSDTPEYREFLENAGKDEDILYVADTFTFQKAFRFDVFKPYAENSRGNIVTAGNWYVNCPVTKKITRKFGYDNPIEALASGDENVILVDNVFAEKKLEYINEHYGECSLKELPEKHGFRMYRVEKCY
ncbi:MAG: hypothetical protein IKP31_01685 [Lachnospiraceae bacterium]|nr:hypothetical protein [Lachnospiraceae bacterium]